MTCRYSTDRPETILDRRSNLLISPDSSGLVYQGITHCPESGNDGPWSELGQSLYGDQVAAAIVDHLANTVEFQTGFAPGRVATRWTLVVS